ncbi:hypothetical protein ACEWY4_015621 [Coilia grayii]|uniref:BOD1/SHG1 domain-containing protein n=1 Tax=Coilia grayii TaxID=363190 RepID=A0ABD1JNR2_9TELE
MAGLPPGDPQLVSMIVNHLKTQGLFDQFRRDCLADVDTKPAYLNLRQRVDNFVSNHLSNHTWSPHLNKNQLRNNIRQLVLQSGMLEQGVDRIVAQVVDPKIHHIFRPQVEKVVREFLSPGSHFEEPPAYYPPGEERQDLQFPHSAVGSVPGTSASAMSILDTISSLNQEASTRTGREKGQKGELGGEDPLLKDAEEAVLKAAEEAALTAEEVEVMNGSTGEQDMSLEEEEKSEGLDKQPEEGQQEEGEKAVPDTVSSMELKTEDMSEEMDIDQESSEERKEDQTKEEKGVKEEEDKDRNMSGSPSQTTEDQDTSKTSNEKQRIRQKARERLKEEYSLEDSDLEGLSDITVSSVHTSDLSSFEGESDDEPQPSDSTEEGEITSEDEKVESKKKASGGEEEEENKDRKPGARRQGYVHKPFLYSRYYSDSDDEVTVEQRRRSVAKDKEERLLKRQQNRERMEEKRRNKQAQMEEQDMKAGDDAQRPRAKEACKEKKVLEKKVALSRKLKRDSRKEGEAGNKKKGDADGEAEKKDDSQRMALPKGLSSKTVRKVSESSVTDEAHRRKSGSVSEEPSQETKKLADKNRTHSFILDLEQGAEELLRPRSSGKFDRHSRKEQHLKDRKERDREHGVSDESVKTKQRAEKKVEAHGEESSHKDGAGAKVSSEDRGEKKSSKLKVEKKASSVSREARSSISEGSAVEEGQREAGSKKMKISTGETPKEKDKEKDRTKGEKVAGRSDPRHLDSTGSSEERSDLELGTDGNRKKDKLIKEVLKRSKSSTDVKHADKHRSRLDSKDSDKEKARGAHSTPDLQRSISETEGEARRSRDVESALKVKMLSEKSRSKSREEPKTPTQSKSDKKASVQDTKSKSSTSVSKADTTKEKKKDGGAKDKKPSEEHSSEKPQEAKSSKKLSSKKVKDSEKKGEALGDQGGKSVDVTTASPLSPTTPETPMSAHVPQPKELGMEVDPAGSVSTAAAPTVVGPSDDAFDALSDITPEPEGEDIAVRLAECEEEEEGKEEPRALPAEADALLSLMEVCSSAERSVVAETEARQEAIPSAAAGLSLQEADLKMKEAALTLLSMDPDLTLSPSLIDRHMTPIISEEVTPPEEMITTSHEAAAQETLVDSSGNDVQEAETTQTPQEMPEVQHTHDEGIADGVAAPVEPSLMTQQEVTLKDATSEEPSEEEKPDTASSPSDAAPVIAPSQSIDVDEVAGQSDLGSQGASADVSTNEAKLTGSSPAVSNIAEVTQPESMENEASVSKQGEVPSESAVTETEEGQTEEHTCKQDEPAQETNAPPDEAPQEKATPESVLQEVEVTRGTRRGRQARLVKQSSSASQSDGQEEERGSDVSEMDEKSEGRVTRRGRRSAVATSKSKTEPEGKDQSSEMQPDTQAEKPSEPEATRRGRSSKASAPSSESQPDEKEGEEGPKEIEKEEVPVRRGRRSGAQTKEATTAARSGLKRKRSEETEDSGEEQSTEEKKISDATEEASSQKSPALTQPEGETEVKQERPSEVKSDDVSVTYEVFLLIE